MVQLFESLEQSQRHGRVADGLRPNLVFFALALRFP